MLLLVSALLSTLNLVSPSAGVRWSCGLSMLTNHCKKRPRTKSIPIAMSPCGEAEVVLAHKAEDWVVKVTSRWMRGRTPGSSWQVGVSLS